MYKAILLLATAFSFSCARSQSTVVTADSIGIGTTSPRALLDVNGTVSIGTPGSILTNPVYSGYKLFVNGNIAAQKLKVSQTDWADHVFDSSYRLLPLREVDRYIKNNGHLPAVPAAGKVISEGVDVGEMEKLLLQKIEELTLYIIEQGKKISELEAALKK